MLKLSELKVKIVDGRATPEQERVYFFCLKMVYLPAFAFWNEGEQAVMPTVLEMREHFKRKNVKIVEGVLGYKQRFVDKLSTVPIQKGKVVNATVEPMATERVVMPFSEVFNSADLARLGTTFDDDNGGGHAETAAVLALVDARNNLGKHVEVDMPSDSDDDAGARFAATHRV